MIFDNTKIVISSFSENTVLIQWPEQVSVEQHQQLTLLSRFIEKMQPWVIEQVPAYASILVYYRQEQISASDFIEKIRQLITNIESTDKQKSSASRHHLIEVCYDISAGWDLTALCQRKNCRIEDIIEWHAGRSYRAYAQGFLPGFCYLASVDRKLHISRHTKPRAKVPVGAVAIAEQQTAVYPDASPGGWHIIGQTRQPMYQVGPDIFEPLIAVGDTVQFVPISKSTFIEQGGVIAQEQHHG